MSRKTAAAVWVLVACLWACSAAATTLEQEFIARPGWCPGLPAGNIQFQHQAWHGIFSGGKEFVEYHREFLAQSDDFRLYGLDTPLGDVDPDAAVIPVVARPGSLLKFSHTSLNGYARPAGHDIDKIHPHPGFGTQSPWVARPAILTLRTPGFHGFTAAGVGNELESGVDVFHGNGHMSIARHDQAPVAWSGDMGNTTTATRDGAFYQWHKNVDNIYGDWAVGQYQLAANTGTPIFFSVAVSGVGAAGSYLNQRRQSNEYQGNNPPTANQYGAIPRIGSDVYVGDNNNSNLVYAAGVRNPGTTNGWDMDAFTVLNPAGNGWYFSVTPGSVGLGGTAVNAQVARGGDVFESTGGGANALYRTEAQLGLLPAASDNLDALEVDQQKRIQATNDNSLAGVYDRPRQWFSLRSGTTFGVQALGGAAVGPSDVLQFNANGDLVIAVAAATLGLGAAGNEVDAATIVDTAPLDVLNGTDRIYYSLAAGSPGLGANSPADIFCTRVDGTPCGSLGGRLEMTAASLGLATTDDLDALDVRRNPTGLGACCQTTGTCTETTPAGCTGTFQGLETVCAATACPSAPGACCLPNGTCVSLSSTACLSQRGRFQGAGVACTPGLCPSPPTNDECQNAYNIPYNYPNGYEPPADNSYATYATYDPPYPCYDHNIFYPSYGSGSIWYYYDVPAVPGPGPTQGRSLYLTTIGTYDRYQQGGYAGDTRLGIYYAPSGNCSQLEQVACGDNSYIKYNEPQPVPNYGGYATAYYDNPPPGRYYVQLSTVGYVNQGQIRLQVYEYNDVPSASASTLIGMVVLLLGVGASVLLRRPQIARG